MLSYRLHILVVLLLPLETCLGFQHFQLRIPNGEIVPHPCKANNVWKGVGHENRYGGGPRNPFGIDFKKNGLVWNRTLCEMDSDGDGRTNGQELGDPNCEWQYDPSGIGVPPTTSVGLSHPGICEPVDSELCGPKPKDVNCEEAEFVCPAMDEPETFNFTIRIPETPVPVNVTTYACMFFALPSDQEYHIVASTPYISNEAVMHHILVYGCTVDISQDVPLNTITTCTMGSGHPACEDNINSWTVGLVGQCEHPEAGILVGGTRGYKFASIQLHWNNPERRNDYTDSSGMNIFLTPKLRTYNAGTLMIAQNRLVIPPNELSVEVEGRCSARCTSVYIQAPINITRAGNHMHYLGKAQFTELRRNGAKVASLADDEFYNYDSPVGHFHTPAIEVRPGDELRTTCVFKSTSRTLTTYFGDATADEMCLSFLKYYPKENVRANFCSSWGSIDMCEAVTGTIQGCTMSRLADMTDPYISNQYASINQKCSTTHCRKECKEYVKALKSSDPCYQGDVYRLRKEDPLGRLQINSVIDPLFYLKVDSCDVEIALEACKPHDVTGSANDIVAHFVISLASLFLSLLLKMPMN